MVRPFGPYPECVYSVRLDNHVAHRNIRAAHLDTYAASFGIRNPAARGGSSDGS